MGIQIVLLPWMAAGQLQATPQQLGWVQSAALLPAMLLMLLGGAYADRPGALRVLPWFYLLLALSHGLMISVNLSGLLSLGLLMVYGLALGSSNAFIQPLRDRALPGVLGQEQGLQRPVVQISLCVYVAQALGVALAGQMQWLGVHWLLAIQCLALLGTAALLMTNGPLPAPKTSDASKQVTILQGLAFVWRHHVLRHLTLLVGFNGFVHLGVFVVALPLLARDVYGQGAAYFSALQLVFVCGNVAATLGLLRRGGVEQPGRSVLFCLLYAGLIMLAISAKPTQQGLFMLVFAWGVVAGVSASMGKSLLQQQTDDAYRGRALSLYQLALFGAAPLGALVCGYAVDLFGALQLFQYGGLATLLLFVVYLGVRPLWKIAPVVQ
jgi:MFS family permease